MNFASPIKKLDWYIIRKFLVTFVFAIMVLAVISCVIDYSEKVDNIVSKKAPGAVVASYYINFIPHITALLFPLFIFIATIFFTSKLAYKSEIIAMISSGISFNRFLRPYFIGGGFLCLGSLYANHWLIPNANKVIVAFENKYINDGNFGPSTENIHLGIGKGHMIYFQSFSFISNSGVHFSSDKVEGLLLKEKVTADFVTYDSVHKTWHLQNVVIRRNHSELKETVVSLKTLDVPYHYTPADLNRREEMKDALTTPELLSFIATEKMRARESLSPFYLELHRRSAQPFAGIVLTIIGACIASKKIRGGSGLHLAIGIALSAIYILFGQLFSVFSTKASLDPFIATWIPNLIFTGVAVYLYRKQII